MVVERYRGDLRCLRLAAAGDRAILRDALIGFTGIGDSGASFFLREVQVTWGELVPFADHRVLDGAAALGLPATPAELRGLVAGSDTFTRLVAGLIRIGLANDHESILDRAAGS
jgi:hypothetical protein